MQIKEAAAGRASALDAIPSIPFGIVAGMPFAGSQLVCWTKLLDQLADRLSAVRDRSKAPHFTFRFRDSYGDRLSMDIQT
jgi:hypothetical protein